MNEYDIQVDLEDGLVVHKEINLVQNDYNSTVFNFKFNDKDYSNYMKVFQLEYPDGKTWTKEIKEDKINLVDLNDEGIYIPILTQSGKYYFDIAIYDENSKLTTTKKSYFKAREKISGEDIELDDRVPILDGLINSATKNINETNNLDIDIENSVITITKKDGTTKSENVKGDAYIITEEDMQEIETNVKSDIQPILENIENISKQAEVIARGRATGYVFETVEDLDIWLQDETNVSKLTLGDNFYIVATNVPDYWWDGTQKRVLETEKPDLTEYAKTEQFITLTQEEYDALETKSANVYYFIIEEE